MRKIRYIEIAKECGLGEERWNTDQQLYDFLERYGRKVEERCIFQVDREKDTWKTSSSAKAVKAACEHIKAMIRGDI